MKYIFLIRHGKVDSDDSEKMDSHLLKKWVHDYDIAPIDPESLPSTETINLIKSSDKVVTSTLRRAIDSAKVLGVEVHEVHSIFNEAGIPEVKIPLLKLKAKTWLVILRLMLLLGLGNKDTSLKASKVQAKEAAKKLMLLSIDHDRVALVGHGGMNWLMGKELIKEGWKIDGKSSHKNWGVTVFLRREI